MIKVDLIKLHQELIKLPNRSKVKPLTKDELYILKCFSGDVEYGEMDHSKLNDEALEKMEKRLNDIGSILSTNNSIAKSIGQIIPLKKERNFDPEGFF